MKLLLFFLFLLPLTHAQKKISLKVNLGGGPVADFLAEDQVFDLSYLRHTVTSKRILSTDTPKLFQTQRFSGDGPLTLRIPVPDGIYTLTLLFAETYAKACVPGARVFDIALGTPVSGIVDVLDGFDLFANAGCQTAHGKQFDKVPSKDGIVVHLRRREQHPSLAGFIVEGYPVPKGDGSEYKAIGREPSSPEQIVHTGAAGPGAAHGRAPGAARMNAQTQPGRPGAAMAQHGMAGAAMAGGGMAGMPTAGGMAGAGALSARGGKMG